jgi:hypothetical protein
MAASRFFPDTPASHGMAIPGWNRFPDSLDAHGIGDWSAAGMPVLQRPICGADSSLGRESPAAVLDSRRAARDGRTFSLRPHTDAAHRRTVFPGARRGVFARAASNGHTLLTGSSRYRNRMWPVAYWRLWSDAIIHQIHLRVFRHIKHQAELQELQAKN